MNLNITSSNWQRASSASALDIDDGVLELHRMLAAKDDLLTETRLEALDTSSKLNSMRDSLCKLRSELRQVKSENKDLKCQMEYSVQISKNQQSERAKEEQSCLSKTSLFIDMTGNQSPQTIDIPIKVQNSFQQIRLGWIRIPSSTREILQDPSDPTGFWLDMDASVVCLFDLYMSRLDPFQKLVLSGKSSIKSYRFWGISRFLCTNEISVNDEENVENGVEVELHSSAIEENVKADYLSFITLRPKPMLVPFLQDLIRKRIALIKGQGRTGKSFFATQLSKTLNRSLIMENVSQDVWVDLSSWIISMLEGDSSLIIIIISNDLLVNVDQIAQISLSQDCADLLGRDCFLGFYLRRTVLAAETVSSKSLVTANDSMILAVNWLTRTFVSLNNYCQEASMDPELKHLSPTIFMFSKASSLQGITDFKLWFKDLWNNVLVDQLRLVGTTVPASMVGTNSAAEDPLNVVIKTWPWQGDLPTLSAELTPVFELTNTWSEPRNSENDDPLVS